MVVFLVPVGPARHELYCEVADAPVSAGEAPKGVLRRIVHWCRRRIVHRFRDILATAEREHRERQAGARVEDPTQPKPFPRRIRDRTMRWMAESIAEQRLLWHLRRCAEATLVHPDDVAAPDAMAELRRQLTIDYERHRRWFLIDLLGFVASGAFMLVPGPNVIAYYFLFRVVGHFLSMRGARHGLRVTRWRTEPSLALSEIRRTLSLQPDERAHRLHDIASRLGLPHLASFVLRTAT